MNQYIISKRKHNMTRITFITMLLFLVNTNNYGHLFASEDTGQPILFHIDRSRDANIVVYYLNIKSEGKPDPHDPILPGWIKHTKKGEKAPLTRIQQRFGYGLHFEAFDRSLQAYPFQFVSIPDEKFYLVQDNLTKKYHVIFFREYKQISLKSIFIQFDGGSFLKPKIDHMKLHGKHANNQKYTEIIRP